MNRTISWWVWISLKSFIILRLSIRNDWDYHWVAFTSGKTQIPNWFQRKWIKQFRSLRCKLKFKSKLNKKCFDHSFYSKRLNHHICTYNIVGWRFCIICLFTTYNILISRRWRNWTILVGVHWNANVHSLDPK